MTTTPTLGLTQFEATDTINFLTQYNTDLSKIDTNAKMTKAIGSDYIYSYTTPPSYTGGTITLYAGTKYVCADGRDANGDIKQTVSTITTNRTVSLTGTIDCDIFIDGGGILFSALTANSGEVNFVSELPSTVPNTEAYRYYVFNEHRYYLTTGSTTANWQVRTYCKVASVRVTSSTITYFKPNLQLNLAQKIGKDKLLMTMAEVNANTDKEFVPSAVAVKELLATLGVDYIDSKGTTGSWNWVKWHSGRVELDGIFSLPCGAGSAFGSGGLYFHTSPVSFPFTVNNAQVYHIPRNATEVNLVGNVGDITTSGFNVFVVNNVVGTFTLSCSIHVIGTVTMV